MTFELYWRALRWTAVEHLHLEQAAEGVAADGLIVGAFSGTPLRLRYQLRCDRDWQTTRLEVCDLRAGGETILVRRNDDGSWIDAAGTRREDLAGTIDVDIAATPFTNTLPVRRLQFELGESRDIDVVYVAIAPTLELRRARQRYTRLDETGRRYLYESLDSDFNAELHLDSDHLVVEYPGVWERIDAAAAS